MTHHRTTPTTAQIITTGRSAATRRIVTTGLSLSLIGLCGLPPLQAAPARHDVAQIKRLDKKPAKACKNQILGMSGLCLLTPTSTASGNTFKVQRIEGAASHPSQTVALNRFVSLTPGEYGISSGQLDQGYTLRFAVQQGLTTNLPLASVKFAAGAGQWYRLQHYQPRNGIDGRGCHAEVVKRGVRAVLPGFYQIKMVDSATANQPGCSPGGTTINLMAGDSVSARTYKLANQTIPRDNSYLHPNGVSALTAISGFQHPVDRLALLPKWKSFAGIQNPEAQARPTLVFSGIGGVHFLIPFELHRRGRDCGVSLARAGMPAHVLLTDCRFNGKRLTGFRINSGAYYTVNNRHGVTALEGNHINNAIQVGNVRFNLQGGTP